MNDIEKDAVWAEHIAAMKIKARGRAHMPSPVYKDLSDAGFGNVAKEFERLRAFHTAWTIAQIMDSPEHDDALARLSTAI